MTDFDIVAEYDYHSANNEVIYQVVRLYPKDFRQRVPDGHGGWTWGLKGARPVPYHLPQLLERTAAGETAFVVEGEKDADGLIERGLCATTSVGRHSD
jgi:putative DNA primase/helicase